ncbi:hypothetical protein V6L76_04060 [Pannonibacter sp. Pt2]|uniref:DUF2946 domain-containing protein n=1 Tax=Pannonibacter anstelovis TaxID=3121537 RepID=A0ABU7ZK69_9HYPH
MKTPSSLFAILRTERTPFALMAVIAIVFRLVLLASPAHAAALAGDVDFGSICLGASQGVEASKPGEAPRAPHDPAACLCATGCHIAITGPLFAAPLNDSSLRIPEVALLPLLRNQSLPVTEALLTGKAIRAPPAI